MLCSKNVTIVLFRIIFVTSIKFIFSYNLIQMVIWRISTKVKIHLGKNLRNRETFNANYFLLDSKL